MGRLHDEIAKAGYELREGHAYRCVGDTDVRFLSVWRDGEKLGELDMTDRPVSFASGLSTTCLDIVSDYYDLDDEQDCILRRGYGRRTAAYLDAASAGIGLLSLTENDRPAKGERNGEAPAGAGMAAIIESDRRGLPRSSTRALRSAATQSWRLTTGRRIAISAQRSQSSSLPTCSRAEAIIAATSTGSTPTAESPTRSHRSSPPQRCKHDR